MKHLLLLLSITFRLLTPDITFGQNKAAKPLPDPAFPGGRHALVIGNGEYRSVSISAPVENARLMAEALRAKGFHVVYLENPSVKAVKTAVKTFSRKLEAAVGVVYFAGHSLSVDGKIFLVPSDAEIRSAADVEYECVELGYLTEKIDRNPMNLVLLETGTDRRLQQLWPEIQDNKPLLFPAMENSLVVMAAHLQQQIGQNQLTQGVFTRELIQQMQFPGKSAQAALAKTISEVEVASGGLQKPVISGQAIAFFRFTPEEKTDNLVSKDFTKRRATPH